jgi:hypothetical membrane protein
MSETLVQLSIASLGITSSVLTIIPNIHIYDKYSTKKKILSDLGCVASISMLLGGVSGSLLNMPMLLSPGFILQGLVILFNFI